MKLHRIIIVASTLLASSGFALAHNGDSDDPVEQTKASTVTRAEVQADLAIYRESGLLALDRQDSVDPSSAEYRAAESRYEKLRNASQAAQLAKPRESSSDAKVVTAKQSSLDHSQQ
ncbi:MAG: DUF4148 domain-containing protein [Paucibacter sp.]|nr:DUF4148 domain-containing protein [Roseateles sp.]